MPGSSISTLRKQWMSYDPTDASELATEITEGTDGVPGGKGVVKKGQWV